MSNLGYVYLNGLILPKKFDNGHIFWEGVDETASGVFHGNHPNYTNWVRDALDKLNSVQDSEVFNKATALSNYLKDQIQVAYQSNKSLHEYFENLKKIDINKL
ncbi:MAG: hypothetical protein KDC16_11015 [Saprospiraceae bacterium]|nr:hypothetical protein [Saprospiraceae bacterium]MCB9327927.1 hypothetical protein [Lewinellaceae bacterium]